MAIEVRALFRERMQEFGGGGKLARALGCSRTFLCMLAKDGSGKRPGRDMEKAIETLLRIPRDSWDSVEIEKAGMDKGHAA